MQDKADTEPENIAQKVSHQVLYADNFRKKKNKQQSCYGVNGTNTDKDNKLLKKGWHIEIDNISFKLFLCGGVRC